MWLQNWAHNEIGGGNTWQSISIGGRTHTRTHTHNTIKQSWVIRHSLLSLFYKLLKVLWSPNLKKLIFFLQVAFRDLLDTQIPLFFHHNASRDKYPQGIPFWNFQYRHDFPHLHFVVVVCLLFFFLFLLFVFFNLNIVFSSVCCYILLSVKS